eukprot:CAMPEP_0184537510 /NCGR_PEP_ID=MMETSP0198_2-20121128/17076_1 /TAXON_ID=1112570 /ORGANISM="Thraustochytrium sp., Strain LLF1b" /LENGTH=500 /DNA_ID=CAMNT_0026930853 /DNA_START=49 /DNA_END=1552 /DNA_ORIENTATION=-
MLTLWTARAAARGTTRSRSSFHRCWLSTTDGSGKREAGNFKCMVFSQSGELEEKSLSKPNLLRKTGLNPRDLVILDGGAHRRPRPTLLVRPKSIVLSLSYVRAVIRHDAVYLFNPSLSKVRSFGQELADYLKCIQEKDQAAPSLKDRAMGQHFTQNSENSGGGGAANAAARPTDHVSFEQEDSATEDDFLSETYPKQLPFELRALEGILRHVSQQYYNRTLIMSPLVEQILKGLSTRGVDPEVLQQLLPMKDALSRFEIETTMIRNVLRDLIHNEEDMVNMLLTDKELRRGSPPPRAKHVLVELMLESYFAEMVDIAQESYYLRKRVEGSVELKLDPTAANVHVAMGSMALALGTTITGLFGSNLINHLENHPSAFYWLAGFSASAIIGAYMGQRILLMRSIPSGHDNGVPFESMFDHLDEIQKILAQARSSTGGGSDQLSRNELRAKLVKSAGLRVSDNDLNIIYETFDANRDGALSFAELEANAETAFNKQRRNQTVF